MTRTITALFDQRHDAEAAENRLKASNVDAGHIRIHDKSSAGFHETGRSTSRDPGMWASIKNAFLPDEDRHTYEEGVRRGGYLLTADVDEDKVDDAVRVLEEANTVDIDERSQQWRSSGWDYNSGYDTDTGSTGAMGAMGSTGVLGAMGSTDRDTSYTDTDRDTYANRDTTRDYAASGSDEQVIPIVEEELVVGKREVDRGGARVRSYVTETPVHEQIRLRNERVNVERRPVDRDVSAGDDAFRERTIDMTATGEEAVVGKTQHVVEEVVVSKTADEQVKDIDDTVRRTDVDIDRDTDIDTSVDRDAGSFRDTSTFRDTDR